MKEEWSRSSNFLMDLLGVAYGGNPPSALTSSGFSRLLSIIEESIILSKFFLQLLTLPLEIIRADCLGVSFAPSVIGVAINGLLSSCY